MLSGACADQCCCSLHPRPCVNGLFHQLSIPSVVGCLEPRVINSWPYLHFLSYISSIYFSLMLLRIQSQSSECLVSLPSIFSTSVLLLSACSITFSIFHNNLHGGAAFLFCSNSFFKKENPLQLRMDSLCFCSSDAGYTHTSLGHRAEVIGFLPWLCGRNLWDILPCPAEFFPGDSEAASPLQSANKNPDPSMSHFQPVQAPFVPATDFISWNVKCHSLSSQPPASVQCWQSSTLPQVLEDKGSHRGVLACNTVMHCAQTTGSASEITDSNAGSSTCKDCMAWKIYSVRKVENLYKANKLPWVPEYLSISNFRGIIFIEIRNWLRKQDRRL